MAFEKLKNSPLAETVCEFRFDPSGTWDWTIPGQLYEKIREEFPERAQLQGLGIALQVGAKVAQQPALQAAQIQTGPDRVQLKRTDGSAMVQVGPHLLAVNHFKSYPQWEQFKALIMRMFETYMSVTHITGIRQIGLRYINQIKVPQVGCPIGDYVTVTPSLNGYLSKEISSFFQRYELTIDRPKAALIHQTGFQLQGAEPFIFLDLDFVSNQVANLKQASAVADWLEAAHECVYHSFKASLNPGFFEKLSRGE